MWKNSWLFTYYSLTFQDTRITVINDFGVLLPFLITTNISTGFIITITIIKLIFIKGDKDMKSPTSVS